MAVISKIALGLLTIFVATFMLFYIFDNISKLAERCKTEEPKSIICEHLSGFTLTMFVLLLVIGGFLFIILTASYILLSS